MTTTAIATMATVETARITPFFLSGARRVKTLRRERNCACPDERLPETGDQYKVRVLADAGQAPSPQGRHAVSVQDLPPLLVRQHLSFHALERVVDRLRVAADLLGHLLVRKALHVEAERFALEA